MWLWLWLWLVAGNWQLKLWQLRLAVKMRGRVVA
jgi:hypothetical protein